LERRKDKELISKAEAASRSLRLTAVAIEVVALISILLLIVFLIDETYGWPLFSGLVLSIFVTVLLAGRVTRARAVTLEIAAYKLELTSEQRRGERPESGAESG
jgi:uncharacterized membrane protein YqjE